MSSSGLEVGFGGLVVFGSGGPTALAAAAAAWLPSASPPVPSVEPCSPPAVTSPSSVAQKWTPS